MPRSLAAGAACIPGTWVKDSLPLPSNSSQLLGADAQSSSDVWAVGDFESSTGRKTLAFHSDGTEWSRTPTEAPPSIHSGLIAVDSLSAQDAWAVGWYQPELGTGGRTLIQHWDGKSWSIVQSPSPFTGDNTLMAVVALGSTNVWAFGQGSDTTGNRSLIEHWDGDSWNVVPSPNPVGLNAETTRVGLDLSSASAASPTDIWVVGNWIGRNDQGQGTEGGTLIEHWDGEQWAIVPSPYSHTGFPWAQLYGIAAISQSNVWAVGYAADVKPKPLILRWDGEVWTAQKLGSEGGFMGVTASSAQDVWMVGNRTDGNTTFGEHWDGSSVSSFPADQKGLTQTYGSAASPSGDVWGVGAQVEPSRQALITHLCPIVVSDLPLSAGFEGLATDVWARSRSASGITTTTRQDTGVAWKFRRSNTQRHDVRDASGMNLYSSGLRKPGGSYTHRFTSAGSYPWMDSKSRHGGSVKVPTRVSRSRGDKTTVIWSGASPPSGFVFDVDLKRGTGHFKPWKRAVKSQRGTFSPPRAGSYRFRSRLRRTKNGTHSGWSPPALFKAVS